MTPEEFALGVEAILLTGVRGHAAHRALDLWWTRYAVEAGGALEEATRKWMKAIEGDHNPARPYPVGNPPRWKFWRRRPPPPPRLADADAEDFGNWSCP